MNLPKSLKTYRLKNILKRTALCLLLLSVITALVVYYRDIIFSYEIIPPFAVACIGVVLYLVPFILSGIPFVFFDTDWSGEITAVDIKTGMGTYTVGGKNFPYTKNDIVLTIKKNNGKTVKHTAKTLGVRDFSVTGYHIMGNYKAMGKIENFEHEYSVGDTVCHFRGFKYNFYIRHPQNKIKHCIVCGTSNNTDTANCWNCHNELLNI